MNLNIQSIHFDADAKLKTFIEKKFNKLDRFFDRIITTEVFLKVQKPSATNNKLVEIKMSVPGKTLLVKEQADTFEAATDMAVDNLKTQLSRHKEKVRKH